MARTYDVGGIQLERPFRVQRFGHFGFTVTEQEPSLRFYSDLLGLQVSDVLDLSKRMQTESPGRDGNVYFMRVGSDHHALILFPAWTMPARPGGTRPGTEHLAHAAWQVATLREVSEGRRWLTEHGQAMARPGRRDPSGANYNFTIFDADGIPTELYYGMDQIGWDGISKPSELWPVEDVALPDVDGAIEPDFPKSREAIQAGLDLRKGQRQRPWGPARYDVGGVMLPRPFRIVRNSPVGIFATDVDEATAYYRDVLGLTLTETIEYKGHRCAFLRANSEHHSVALYPLALRGELGMWNESICMHYGMQVPTYSQLRDAVSFLTQHGVAIRYLPPELTPGIDYAALAIAPDGHAILLYYYMEQIGWDGRPRPASERRKIDHDHWPQTLSEMSDTYRGCVFQGPLG